MADTPEMPKILADNPAAAQRYLRMVAAVGGVPDVGDVVDDLVLEALYGPYEEVDPDNPNFVRWRYPEVEEGALAELPSGASPDSEVEAQDYGQDDRPRHGVPTQDWLSRGLKHPAGAGVGGGPGWRRRAESARRPAPCIKWRIACRTALPYFRARSGAAGATLLRGGV
ncbi:hypothetical protein [Erythrobacter sp. A6_0]|uniref:hypothetical protein n=1 Tax=Erythrobacter sp. A6_0 TaxID=2821089 RepID=UPI001ADADD5B|nr:hypothetical protein [Erythrobacter sp. A6_0]MBO9510296.1 hypothetical protein [Erythrobacter sp. A6_0]